MFGRTSKRTSISGRLHVFPRIFRRKFKMSFYVYKVCFCDDDRDDDDDDDDDIAIVHGLKTIVFQT